MNIKYITFTFTTIGVRGYDEHIEHIATIITELPLVTKVFRKLKAMSASKFKFGEYSLNNEKKKDE